MIDRKGHWIRVSDYNFECSCCHSFFNNAYLNRICPNCKAFMSDEVEDDRMKEDAEC